MTDRDAKPWYRRCYRWGQTNLSEIDPIRYDAAWWREHGPYYDEFLPDVLREIVERSRPDGITDNSWSGLDRDGVCYCGHCARTFRDATGLALPRAGDWNAAAYRCWIA